MQLECKQKNSRETVRAILIMITKKNSPVKISVEKGTEFAGDTKKNWKAEGIQFYSTLSETEAGIAERRTCSSKKYFTVTWKIMDTNEFTNCINSSQL